MKRKESKVEIKKYRFHYRMTVRYNNDTSVVISFVAKSQINSHSSTFPTKLLMLSNNISHSCDESNVDLAPTGYVFELIRKETIS